MRDQLLSDCRDYISYVDHVQTRLAQLSEDLRVVESLNNRHPYCFAVDFAELMALAFPLSSSHHIQRMPEESKSAAFSREIAVLSFVLSHTSPQIMSATRNLLILPPYIDEMRAELAMVKNNLIKVNDLVSILRGIQGTLFTADGYKERWIGRIANDFRESGRITQNDWLHMADHMKESYSDYLAVIVSSAYGGATFLRQLIDDKAIRGWQSYFDQLYPRRQQMQMGFHRVFAGDTVTDRLYEYVDRITRKVRSRKDELKRVPNMTDAAACVMLRDINDILCEYGEERRVILITHSRAMTHAVDPVRVKIGTDYRMVPGVRDLDYFWLYCVHMYLHSEDHGIDNMLSAVNWMNTTMLRFKEVYEKICDNRDVSDEGIEKANNQLHQVKECMQQLSNASFAMQSNKKLLDFLYRMSAGKITVEGYHKKREWAKRLLNVLRDDESVKVLSSKTREISAEIRAISDADEKIGRMR